VGKETLQSTLGLQDHQTCPNWRNLLPVSIWNRGDHLGRH